MKIKKFLATALTLAVIGSVGTMANLKTEKTSAASAESEWFTSADLFELNSTHDQKYQDNRQFLCATGIEFTGNRMWVSTYSGGTTEPHQDNYSVFKFSDDNGVTWENTYIIDNLTYPDETRLLDMALWEDPNGKLWIFYNQTSGQGNMFGEEYNPTYPQAAHAYVLENPTADPEDFVFTNKGMLIKGGRIFSKPIVVTHDGITEWLVSSHVNWTEYTDCYSSTDNGETWTKKGSAKGVACGAHEAWITELSDGTLMMMKRIDQGVKGGVELSYSSNYGVTWSNYENELGDPFVAPGSRMVMYKLQSGNLIFISNHHASRRWNLKVFMSTNDGMTWPYELMLDDRQGAGHGTSGPTYPDVTQTEDGRIWVSWDYERTSYAETRFSVFTEQDIINGKFSKDCIYKRPIFKNYNTYNDVVRFERFGGIPTVFAYGTTKEAIANSQLSNLTIFTSNGNEYEISGSWDSEDFVPNKAGEYKFTFSTNQMPNRVEDVQGILSVYITVLDENQVATTGIEIASNPTKTAYSVGEDLDLSGLVVKAKLSDGGKKTLTESDITISGYDKNKKGEQTITISYEGQTATFKVTVGEATEKGGCNSTISMLASAGYVSLFGGLILIRKKKNNK